MSGHKRAAHLRERAAHLLPNAVMLFPFEVFVAVLMFFSGAPTLVGLLPVATISVVVGPIVAYAWTAGMTLAGMTVGFGLLTRRPIVISSGLQLTAVTLVALVLAVLVLAPLATVWPTVLIHGSLALLSLARSLHFRRVPDIQEGATRLKDGVR